MSDMSEAVALYYEKKYEEALKSLEKTDEAFKVHYGYMELMGSIYGGLMDVEKSDFYFKKALSVSPSQAAVFNNWGIAKEKMGEPEKAKFFYLKSIEIDPQYIHPYNNLSLLLIAQRQFKEARLSAEELVRQFPNYALGYVTLGNLEKEEGHIEKALNAYHHAMQLNPKILDAPMNACVTLIEMGKLEEAREIAEWSLDHHPQNPEVFLKIGLIYKKQNDYEKAARFFSEVTEINPKNIFAYEQLSNCFYKMGVYEQSIDAIKRLMENNPQYRTAEIYVQMADAYSKLKKIDQAEKLYQKANQINPDSAMLKNNYMIFLTENNQTEKVVFEKETPLGLYNNALIKLRLAKTTADFKEAWALYENRWQVDENNKKYLNIPLPVWKGEPVEGRVLIWGEQGVGDLVLFLSLIPKLIKQSIKPTLFIDKRLHPIVLRSFGEDKIEIFDAENPIIKHIKAHLPIGSLGKIYVYPPFESLGESYLKADPHAVAYFKNKFNAYKKSTGSEKIIGFCWKTKNKFVETDRNVDLSFFEKQFKSDRFCWVNLQYGALTKDEESILKQKNIFEENIDPLKDLDLFFAMIGALDGILSADNATVHFSGSLGVPTAVLIPANPDWKWKAGSADPNRCIWYSKVRIFEGNNIEERMQNGLDYLWKA